MYLQLMALRTVGADVEHRGGNQYCNMQGLAKALEGCTSALLTSAAAMLSNEHLQTMLHALGRVIDDDAEVSKSGGLTAMQMCCCVKPGVDQFLGGARAAFSGLTEDLQERVCASCWIPTCSCSYCEHCARTD